VIKNCHGPRACTEYSPRQPQLGAPGEFEEYVTGFAESQLTRVFTFPQPQLAAEISAVGHSGVCNEQKSPVPASGPWPPGRTGLRTALSESASRFKGQLQSRVGLGLVIDCVASKRPKSSLIPMAAAMVVPVILLMTCYVACFIPASPFFSLAQNSLSQALGPWGCVVLERSISWSRAPRNPSHFLPCAVFSSALQSNRCPSCCWRLHQAGMPARFVVPMRRLHAILRSGCSFAVLATYSLTFRRLTSAYSLRGLRRFS
jgi:hypothetical protein